MKRMLAMLLAMAMVVTMLPVPAFADDTDEEIEVTEAVEETTEATQPEETEVPTEPETVPEETEVPAEPEETEPVGTEEPTEEVTEKTEPEETEPEITEVPEEEDGEEAEDAVVSFGNCGENLTWTLDDEGTLTISGKGAMENYAKGKAPWDLSAGLVKILVIKNGVTSIGASAFSSCYSLVSITIPESVVSIGASAFYNASRVSELKLSSIESWLNISFADSQSNPLYNPGTYYSSAEVNVYVDGVLQKELIIPTSITSIPCNAFTRWNCVTSVTIPNSVKNIGSYAFYGCKGLESVSLSNKLTAIEEHTFDGCSKLSSVTIPNSVTGIGISAFSECNGLTSVTIGNGVKNIGDSAFYSCSSLSNVTIPNGVISIGASAFSGCSKLDSITIPNSVTTIGVSAFKGSGLNTITIPDSVTELGSNAFESCRSLTSAIVGNKVKSIGDKAFYECYSLANVTFGNSMETIGKSAFYYCEGLTDIVIPDSVQSIENSAFSYCNNLESVSIGKGVTSIGSSAFQSNAIRKLYISSLEQWLRISLGNETANPLGNAEEDHYDDYDDYYDDYVFSHRFGTEVYVNGKLLEKLEIPDGITRITANMFNNWDSITEVTLPDSVQYVAATAFYSCSNLKKVTFGSNIKQIGCCAFANDYSLKSITFTGSIPSFASYSRYYWDRWGDDEYYYYTYYTSFAGVTAAVLYPCTEEMEEYPSTGGQLSWVKNHDLIDEVIPNTCTEEGYTKHTCSICGATYNDTFTDPAHTYVEWSSNAESHWSFCTVCGTKSAVESHVPDRSAPTADADQLCKVCGYVMLPRTNNKGTCGKNLTWVLDESGKLTITGTGAMEDFADDATPWNDKLGQIKSVVIESGVTHLGDRAFQYADKLSSVSLPETLTSCGQFVFNGCISLTSVKVPDSLTALGTGMFRSCSSLKTVTLPAGLKSMATWAFYGCTSLTSFTVPAGVTEIGRHTFRECTNLTSVNLSNVTKLDQYAFAGCTSLKSIELPDTLISIETRAFQNCSGLKSIVLPNSVTAASDLAFSGCSSLTEVTLSESMTELKYQLFKDCSSLTSIVIPEKVAAIGSQTFVGCSNLKTVTFQGDAPKIGGSCFSRTFTANYPCSGKGWSSAVFSNTGAAPTMVKYHPEKYYTESARVEPTCTEPGSYGEILCGSCGAKIKDATAIPAKGHSYEAVVTAPTCTEKGFTTYTCTVCGDSYVGDETELAPHTFEGAWFSSEEGHWHYCAVCNAQGPVEAHVPDRNAPTVDADQLCKLCGYVMQTRKPLIVIDTPRSLIVAGTSLKLSYHVVPEQDIKVVWKLGEGDEAYATLSQTGELTAKAVAEQHTITVYAEDAAGVCVAGKMSMSVCPVPTSITILEGSSFTVNVNEGGSLTLTAKCGPAGCAGNVIWKTSDTAGTYGTFRDNGNNTCTLSNLKLPGGKAASITLTASVYGTNVKSSAVVKLVSAPVPGSIQVTGPETLCGGAAGTYKASVNPDQPLTGSWVYALRSQDSAYASITAAGKLTTKAVPEAVDVVVSAYTRDYPDVVGTTVVHLVPSVQEITILSPEAVVNDGVLSVNLTDSNTIRLEAAVLPTSAMQTGTWKTSSAAIATVNSSGQVTFQKTGTVTITFTANDGSKKTASVKICAGIPAMNLQISGDETLASGGKAALKATFSNIPTVKKLTWSSSDPAVATVTASGAVTAKTVYEEKTVTITAKATDGSGQTAEHVITVQPKANVLPVWDASGNVVTNQTLYLDTQNSVVSLTAPAGAKWTSSAPKVVEVVNGRLTLQKAGSAVITVKSADGKQTAKVTIKVSTLVRSLTINTDCSVPLTSGKGKLTLKASVNVDATNKAVTWTSSDPGVASVTSAGAVTAKAGVLKDTEVTITATAKDGSGVTAQATIKVIPASTAVHVVSVNALTCADGMQLRAGETLNGRTITLPVSRSFSLGAKVFPNALGAHADQSVTWKSSSAKIAKVDANGVVTALKAGTVTITVKTADGKTNTVKIKFV